MSLIVLAIVNQVKVNGDLVDGQSDDSDDEKQRREPISLDIPDYPPPQPPAEGATKKSEDYEKMSEATEDEPKEDRVYDEPKPIKNVVENHVEESDDVEYQTPASNKPLKEPPPNVLYVVSRTVDFFYL